MKPWLKDVVILALAGALVVIAWRRHATSEPPSQVRVDQLPGMALPQQSSAEPVFQEAVAQLRAQRDVDATGALERCLQIDPSYRKCLHGLGFVWARRGELERAIDYYDRYLQVAPDAPDVGEVRQRLREYRERLAATQPARP